MMVCRMIGRQHSELSVLGVNAQSWLPRLHQKIATGLIENGWSQAAVAEVLATTQSTVSRWLTRPSTALRDSSDDDAIDDVANRIVEELLRHGAPSGSISFDFTVQGDSESSWSANFNLETNAKGDSRDRPRILSELTRFGHRLPNIPSRLNPAVGINVAAAISTANDRADIAAFPGRLLLGNGRLLSKNQPKFGASKHLSGILLRLRELEENDRRDQFSFREKSSAIINLKPPEGDVIEAYANEFDLAMIAAPKGICDEPADLLIDRGDFGWEPSLYIVADSVKTLRHRLEALIEQC
jgi:predicted fused transcriptional regulator/phosphomethylpyrimidine kinase